MARLTYAALALLALTGGAAASATTGTQNLGRALAEAAAAQVAAPSTPSTTATAAGSTIITAAAASMAGGKLILKQASPVTTADTPGVGAIPASLASIVSASKKGEPAFAVLSSASGPGGKPTISVIEISDPVLEGDTLTMAAQYVAAGSTAPLKGGAVEAALQRPSSAAGGGPAPAVFDAKTVSLAVDNAAAPAPPSAAPGEKSIIGAAVGAGIGDMACGTLCAMGGAAIGGSYGGYYNRGYYNQPVYYSG
jgi:hypothetical protein